MKRLLAIVHSYYMLLTVIQLRKTVYADCEMDLLLSDASTNSKNVFENIRNAKIFNNVYYYKMSSMDLPKNTFKLYKIFSLLKFLLLSKKMVSHIHIDNLNYDTVLCYVPYKQDDQFIFNAICSCNPQVESEIYEEGISSYFSELGIFAMSVAVSDDITKLSFKSKVLTIMKLLGKGKNIIANKIKRSWFFRPELVQFNPRYEICKIPSFNFADKNFVQQINQIFCYKPHTINSITSEKTHNRIIFLEGCSFADGREIDDIELLNIFAENIGAENITVKLHPRTREDRFTKLGYNVMKENIPLELMALNAENRKTIFITVESSAPISCILNFEADNIVIQMFKCSKYDDMILKFFNFPNFKRFINDMQNIVSNGNIYIPENINDLRMLSAKIKDELKEHN